MGRFVDTTCRIAEFLRHGGHKNGSYRTISSYRGRTSRNVQLGISRQANTRAFWGIPNWAVGGKTEKRLGNQSRVRPGHRPILSEPLVDQLKLGCLRTQSASAGLAAAGTFDTLFQARGYSHRQRVDRPQRQAHRGWAHTKLKTIGEACVAVTKESLSQTIRWILDRMETDHWSLPRVEQALNLA